MSDYVTELISNVLTMDHFIYFTGGWIVSWLFRLGGAFQKHRRIIINWRAVIMSMSVIVLVFVTLSTHRANECVVEFNRTLTVRSNITAQDQQISLEQRKEIYELIHDVVFPPPGIASLDPSDPIRQQFVVQAFIDTDRLLVKSFAQQADNEAERERNPLPTPSCS